MRPLRVWVFGSLIDGNGGTLVDSSAWVGAGVSVVLESNRGVSFALLLLLFGGVGCITCVCVVSGVSWYCSLVFNVNSSFVGMRCCLFRRRRFPFSFMIMYERGSCNCSWTSPFLVHLLFEYLSSDFIRTVVPGAIVLRCLPVMVCCCLCCVTGFSFDFCDTRGNTVLICLL